MKRSLLSLLTFILISSTLASAEQPARGQKAEGIIPVRGFCIAAPQTKELDRFIKFIDEELGSH